jgi:PTH1 family peptidyl-tRNA hydrolase
VKLIVGLGNPGKKYEKTRHNVGFRVVERLAAGNSGKWEEKKRYRALMSGPYFSHHLGGNTQGRYLLIKPTTFMNRSGEAVGKLVREFKVKPENLWVVYDDVDLALGKVRIRRSSKKSTHQGIASILKVLDNEEFVRFRLGVDRPPPGLRWEDYVLGEFRRDELETIERGIEKMAQAIGVALTEGITAAMNRYHGPKSRFSFAA